MISGGQSGADRVALVVAWSLGIATGGFAPPHFQTYHGKDPTLAEFGLVEIEMKGIHCFIDFFSQKLINFLAPPSQTSVAAAYVARSIRNVNAADATVAFRLHSSVGTDKTILYCASGKWGKEKHAKRRPHRPCLVISSLQDADYEQNVKLLRKFIVDNNVRILNVAGHREAPSNCPHFEEKIQSTLREGLKCFLCGKVLTMARMAETDTMYSAGFCLEQFLSTSTHRSASSNKVIDQYDDPILNDVTIDNE